jgi:hypothetical protein
MTLPGATGMHHHDHTRSGQDELAAPLGQATSGRLLIAPGASHLTVRGDPTTTDLYRAHFPPPPPRVRVHSGTVTLHYPRMAWLRDPRTLLRPRPRGQVTLNGAIPWHLRVRGGTAHTSFDLAGLVLYALELGGAASHVTLILPRPAGTVPIRVAGGTHDLTILRPPGVPIRVRVRRGASGLTLDTQHFGAIGGPTHWQSPDYDHHADRYDLAIGGGADSLTVRTG